MKRIVLLVCLALTPMLINAQDQAMLPDSLVLQLQRTTGDDYQRVFALNDIINYYTERNEYSLAKPYMDEIERIAETLNNNYVKTLSCYYTIACFIKSSDYRAAIPYLYEIRMLLDKLDDSDRSNQLRIYVYDMLALFYYTQDMLPQAYENLNLCFRINEKLNDERLDFNQNRRLMMLLLSTHKYEDALAIGKKIAGYEDSNRDMTYYHIEMADAYAALGNVETAIVHFDSALSYDSSNVLHWLINDRKGQMLLNNEQYEAAFDCFDSELAALGASFIQREDSLYIVYRNSWSRALRHKLHHNYDSALYCVNRSLEIVREFVSLGDECELMTLKTELLRQMGHYEEALDNVFATRVLTDSLAKVQNVKNVEAMMFQQQMKEYEAEQEYLNFQRESQQRIRFLVLAIVALLLLLGLVVLLLVTNKRRLKAKMTEEELEVRNRELTEAAVVMMKKNETYNDVINQLQTLKTNTTDRESKKAIDHMSKQLEQTMDDDYYEEFSVRFKQVHPEFIAKLTKRHPDLSPNEIKICSFLRLNMSSKEISALTGQSPTTIDKARFRIRRKLGFAHDDHGRLSNYLMQL